MINIKKLIKKMRFKKDYRYTDDDICLGETFEFKFIDRLIIPELWWGKVKLILSDAEMSDFKITKTVNGNWIFWLPDFNNEDEKRIKVLCCMEIGTIASFLLDLTKNARARA